MGFDQTILGQISHLRDVLQRYHGFAVVRELIQNADDARATRLDIGCIGTLPNADHPLLKSGPSLFVVNDGPFTASNARSIAQLGLSDKAGGTGSIGKFGLGLKSILHFGEVYFYLSSATFDVGDPDARYKSWDIQNPWHDRQRGDSYYREWDKFSETDRRRIEDRLGPLLTAPDWFCLVVPLRKKQAPKAGATGSERTMEQLRVIATEYPGDAASPAALLFSPNFEVEVARLLPLLRNLRTIQCWGEEAGQLRPLGGLTLDGPHHRSRASATILGERDPLGGSIRVDRRESPGTANLLFAGCESFLDHPGLANLARRDDWPGSIVLPDPERPDDGPTFRPEEPIAHAAACFSRIPVPGPGRLQIRWASYLPVQQPEPDVLALSSPDEVTLTLHGRFFVDAGRVGIDFGDPDAPGPGRHVRQQWNDMLRDDGTLDLVIPALNEFAARLAPEESAGLIRELTGALRQSPLFQNRRSVVCQRHGWAYLVGRDGAAWTRLEGDSRLHAVPESAPTDPPLAEVFPQLPTLGREDFRLTYRDWPSLRRSDDLLPWPEKALERLLRTDQAASFRDPSRMSLVVRTLGGALPNPPQPAVVDRLIEIARAGLMGLGWGEMRQQRGAIGSFLDLIPSDRKLAVDLRTVPGEVAELLVRPLWGLSRIPLVVPFGVGEARPSAGARERMVGCLLALDPAGPTDAFLGARADLACQVVRASGGDLGAAWAGLDDRAIFPATGGDGAASLATRAELATALRGSRLFVDRLGLAGALRESLDDGEAVGSILSITRPLADSCFGIGVVPDADARSCLVTLATRPALARKVEPRLTLVARLLADLGSAEVATHRAAFRYLLHNDPTRFDDDAPLLFEAGAGSATVWVDLAERSLAQDDGGWRVVPRDLAEQFNRAQRAVLGVNALDRPGIVAMLRTHGPGRLDLADLHDDDVRTLIEEAAAAEFDVIRALPIHQGRAGHRVAIDDRCRWEGNFAVAADLAEGVVILVPHSNRVVAERQREIHPPTLDARGAIDLVMKHPQPSRFGPTVLAALGQLGTIPGAASNALKATRWVTTTDGRVVAPSQVVRLSFNDEAVAAALAAVVDRDANDVVSILELAEPFRKSSAITALAPQSSDALARLGRCLGRDPRYRIGNLLRDEVRLDDLRFLFRDAPAGVMPCLGVLRDDHRRAATRENIDANLANRLLPELIHEIPPDRLRDILRFLADAHRTASPLAKDKILDGYLLYLQAATKAGSIRSILADIPLLNQTGAWTGANLLTMRAANVHAASLLDERVAVLLANQADRHDFTRVGAPTTVGPDTAPPLSLSAEAEQAVEPFRDYLEEWAALPNVNRELLGGLVALLGDGPGVTTLAEQFLGNFDRAALRDQLKWDSSSPYIVAGTTRGGAGRDLAHLMRARRVIVELSDGDQVAVTNLLGQPILVPVHRAYDDLLLPHVDLGPYEGHEYLRLRLRRVRPRHLPTHLDAAAVLRRTARRLLEVVDRQQVANFDQIWDRLARSEQLDLEVAQRMILNGLIHVLQTLGLRHQPPLAAPLKCVLDADRALAQVKEGNDKRRDRDEAERRKQAALEELRDLVERDAEAQRRCLAAVRAKLQRYEYQPDSIPFELFQNADDAAVELGELLGASHPPEPSARRFVAAASGSTLWFAAWGRAINRHQFAGFDGTLRGFDQDLEKMLTLNWSDKGQHEATTGKFGLGFKSVLLASDRPRVVSDRLAFEVAGGLLPARMAPDRTQALRDRLREFEEGTGGTVVELPLAGVSVDGVLGRFRTLSPLLPVFARRIRDCRVSMADGRDLDYRWEPTILGDGIEVGSIRGFDGRLLVLRGHTASLALLVTPDGIGKLPDRFPMIWVTAPTRHEANLGFALNAPFTLDVGRSQLARACAANDEVADHAGVELGVALLALFARADADWPAFGPALGLRVDLTPAAFWRSLWDRLGRLLLGVADPPGPLLRRVFWGAPNHGMRHLITEAAALPTGLPEPLAGLTRLDAVRGSVVGLLLNEAIAREVAQWPHAATFPAGSLVAERVCDDLIKLGALDKSRVETISMAPLIDRELGSSLHASAEFARRLGRLVSLPGWTNWQREIEGSRTPNQLRERLNYLRFFAQDRSWQLAGDLLLPGSDEEGLQAGFAPARAILHTAAYTAEGIACFRACRPSPQVNVAILKQWAVAAIGEARGAVLLYLDRGRLGRELAEALRGGSHWLTGLDERSALALGLDFHQAGVVLGRLRIDLQKAPVPRPAPPPPAADQVLTEIYGWWTRNRELCVDDYEREWYPEARFPSLATSMGRDSSHEHRKGWMVLLMLGAMHTMGRTRAAAHSGFLKRCERKGWLDTFSGPTTRLELWMEVLIDYLDKNVARSVFP